MGYNYLENYGNPINIHIRPLPTGAASVYVKFAILLGHVFHSILSIGVPREKKGQVQ